MTPLRQALSEALTDLKVLGMRDKAIRAGEDAYYSGHFDRRERDAAYAASLRQSIVELAALDASTTTARETPLDPDVAEYWYDDIVAAAQVIHPTERHHAIVRVLQRLVKSVRAAALPSPPPAAPPEGPRDADGPGVECEHRCLPYAAKARMEEPITVLDEVAAECRRQDKWRAIAECLKCGEPVEQPRTGRSTSECLCCGAIYGMDFFRVHKEKR